MYGAITRSICSAISSEALKQRYPDYVDDEILDEFEMYKEQEKVRKILRNYNNLKEDIACTKKRQKPVK